MTTKKENLTPTGRIKRGKSVYMGVTITQETNAALRAYATAKQTPHSRLVEQALRNLLKKAGYLKAS